MSIVKLFPLFSLMLFAFGLMLFIGGIRIIKFKRMFSVSKNTSPEKWEKPKTITGKEAVRAGITYIILGIFIMAFSILFSLPTLNLK